MDEMAMRLENLKRAGCKCHVVKVKKDKILGKISNKVSRDVRRGPPRMPHIPNTRRLFFVISPSKLHQPLIIV